MAAGIEQQLYIPGAALRAGEGPVPHGALPAGRPEDAGHGLGEGVVVVLRRRAPVIEYNPAKVKTVPKTPADLLAWAKANPNKFIYARPANSGPARIFIMGLPYLLGDSNPQDPIKGWDKTWAYLQELNQYVEIYPAGTGADDEGNGEGSAT